MKIAIFGQYYQNNTAEIVTKVVAFLEKNEISIAFERTFLEILQEKNIVKTPSSGNVLNLRIQILILLLYTTYSNPPTLHKLLFSLNVGYGPHVASRFTLSRATTPF